MQHRVLYISYDGMTDPLGQSQVLPYLSGLSKRGYSYTLISFEKEEVFEKNKTEIERICAANQIEWVPLKYTKRPPVFSTIYDINVLLTKVKKICTEKKISIVHCRSYIAAFAGIYAKKNFNVKFVFDMRGFWVDERIDGNIWNLKNPLFKMIYNYFKKQEIKFFSNADYTISLTYNGKEEIHSWKNIAQQPIPIQVIPCCVDTSKFNHTLLDANKLIEYKNDFKITSDDLVISYVGSIGTWYMVDEMMCFFKELKKEFSNAKFLFITTSPKEEILTYAAKHQIDANALIITSGKRDQMPYLISLSNFSLFFIKPLFSKKASSPTKQAEIMSLGIPIICNDLVGDTARIIHQYHAGFVIKEFNTSAYLQIIQQLKNTTFNSTEIRNGAIEFYDLEMGVHRYEEVYNSLTKK